MKGRKPTPVALKLVAGNPGKRPARAPSKSAGAEPAMPKALDAVARAEWRRVVPRLVEVGLLTDIDGAALAAYCDAYSMWVRASTQLEIWTKGGEAHDGLLVPRINGNLAKHPLLGIISDARADMVRYASEFGMTPSARARLDIEIGPRAPSGTTPPSGSSTESKFF